MVRLRARARVRARQQRRLGARREIDPRERDLVDDKPAGPAPVGSPAYWITDDDFPEEASGKNGVVTMLWAIGLDGRVHDLSHRPE